jgi:phosphatidylserine decarboxylase
VVCLFEGARGPFSLVLVGATIVGSMQTVWHGAVNTKRPGQVREWRYDDQNIELKKGVEMGRFLLGSTVIMTFPKGDLAFNAGWAPATSVRLGEEMANYRA